MRQRSSTLLGGWLYTLAVSQYLVAQFYAAAAWSPPYDWLNGYISDLGNTACAVFAAPHGTPAWVCSPRHALMNAAFVASGAMLMAGTAALWRFWPGRAATRCAMVLLLIAGCGKVLVGLAPENEHVVLHSIGALNIPIASVAIVLISATTFQVRKSLSVIGLTAFALGSVGTALLVTAQFAGSSLLLGLGMGGMERLAGYPANAWMVSTGIAAIADGLRSRGP